MWCSVMSATVGGRPPPRPYCGAPPLVRTCSSHRWRRMWCQCQRSPEVTSDNQWSPLAEGDGWSRSGALRRTVSEWRSGCCRQPGCSNVSAMFTAEGRGSPLSALQPLCGNRRPVLPRLQWGSVRPTAVLCCSAKRARVFVSKSLSAHSRWFGRFYLPHRECGRAV